jgi:protein ImuB
VWLLEKPELLDEQDGLPRRHDLLRLLEGPERIETDWWNGRDVSRDYYVALDSRGVRLWVFRERTSPHGWFLHGVFG